MLRTRPQHVRKRLLARDRGVCALCGLDAVALDHEWQRVRRHGGMDAYRQFRASLESSGFDPGISLWAADHIVPVVDGGGLCGIDGYRTLCVPCHKRATAELSTRRAAERRRDPNQLELFAVP